MGYAFIIGFFIAHTLGYGAISSGPSIRTSFLLQNYYYSITEHVFPNVTVF